MVGGWRRGQKDGVYTSVDRGWNRCWSIVICTDSITTTDRAVSERHWPHILPTPIEPEFSDISLRQTRSQQWRSRTFGRSGRWSNLPPFRLRFWKLESLFKVQVSVVAQDTEDPTRCSCDALFLSHANTHEIIQSEFSREFLKTIFACLPPLASAARCGPRPPHPLATPVSRSYVSWVIEPSR